MPGTSQTYEMSEWIRMNIAASFVSRRMNDSYPPRLPPDLTAKLLDEQDIILR